MIVNANSIVQYVIQIKNGILKHVNLNVKIIASAKKDYSWNPSTYICENSKYLKSIADTSVTEYDEIVIVMDIESTKKDKCCSNNKDKCYAYNKFNKLSQ